MISDPRLLVINERLKDVDKIIAVMSSKGGVGKTLLSTLLALIASKKGLMTGLLDLDFTNSSTHIVLGIDPSKLEIIEEKGIIPPSIHGLKYLTIALFSRDQPLPLRGQAVDDAFKELLAITRWGRLDVLFIDTPPGISNIHLNLLSYLGDKAEIILVATPSPLAINSVIKLIKLLHEGGFKVRGLIENMSNDKYLEGICRKHSIEHLGSVPYIANLDNNIGRIDRILSITELVNNLEKILVKIL